MTEQKYQAIVLKKQLFGEGDEIITFYTKESGKLRALAKSSKFNKSRLQHALQTLFCINLTMAGRGGLPKIIGAEIKNIYPQIRENFEALKISFYALELVIKFTPDEQQHEDLFLLLQDFLQFLNDHATEEVFLSLALLFFKIKFLSALGLGISDRGNSTSASGTTFSNAAGGFLVTESSADALPVSSLAAVLFTQLSQSQWQDISHTDADQQARDELHHIVSNFLCYQLEREIKSESLLGL